MKITMEMSKGAYEIVKKVYSGQITRSEGKIEINRSTGMNEGSTQAFITIFLALKVLIKLFCIRNSMKNICTLYTKSVRVEKTQ